MCFASRVWGGSLPRPGLLRRRRGRRINALALPWTNTRAAAPPACSPAPLALPRSGSLSQPRRDRRGAVGDSETVRDPQRARQTGRQREMPERLCEREREREIQRGSETERPTETEIQRDRDPEKRCIVVPVAQSGPGTYFMEPSEKEKCQKSRLSRQACMTICGWGAPWSLPRSKCVLGPGWQRYPQASGWG